MAFPYTEGEGTFLHEALRTERFNPMKPKHFYAHVLLEVVVNESYSNVGFTQDDPEIPRHWRTEPQRLKGFLRNKHVRYSSMTVMYGPERWRILRSLPLTASLSYETVNATSNQTHVVLVPVPIPRPGEKMYIDLTYPLRALYIPKAHIAKPGSKDRCSYYGLIFRQREVSLIRLNEGVQRDPPRRLTLPRDDRMGWGYRAIRYTVEFDISSIAARLTLPDDFVDPQYRDIYDAFVRLHDWSDVYFSTSKRGFPLGPLPDLKGEQKLPAYEMVHGGISLAKVASTTFGIPLKYDGESNEWVTEVMIGLATVAVGTIPVIGPLAALGTAVLLQVVANPDIFNSQDALLKKIPELSSAVIESSKLLRKFVKKDTLKQFFKAMVVAKTLANAEVARGQPASPIVPIPPTAKASPQIKAKHYFVALEEIDLSCVDVGVWIEVDKHGLAPSVPDQDDPSFFQVPEHQDYNNYAENQIETVDGSPQLWQAPPPGPFSDNYRILPPSGPPDPYSIQRPSF